MRLRQPRVLGLVDIFTGKVSSGCATSVSIDRDARGGGGSEAVGGKGGWRLGGGGGCGGGSWGGG